MAKTNGSRASSGLSSYAVASDLSSVAQRHAESMARSKSIYHNSSLGSDVCCWRSIGENVGYGSSASAVHQMFMNSSVHRANILSSSFTEVGIGAARGSDGQLYVDEVFRQRMGSHSPVSHHSHQSHTSHTTTTYRSSPVHVARVARPSVAAVLKHRLRTAATERGRVRDPVAAASTFPQLMAALAR